MNADERGELKTPGGCSFARGSEKHPLADARGSVLNFAAWTPQPEGCATVLELPVRATQPEGS